MDLPSDSNCAKYINLPTSALADESDLCLEVHDKGKTVRPGRPAAGKPGWSVKYRKDGQGGRNSDLRVTESLSERLPIHNTIFPSITQSPD